MENGNPSYILMSHSMISALLSLSIACHFLHVIFTVKAQQRSSQSSVQWIDLLCWSILHLPQLPVVQRSGQMLKCRWLFTWSRATSHAVVQPALQQSSRLYSLQ